MEPQGTRCEPTPVDPGPGLTDRLETEADRQRILEELVQRTAALTGYDFLEAMVRELSAAVGARYVFVGEIIPGLDRVQSLARTVDGELAETIEYALDGAPCEEVAGGSACFIEDGVAELYPRDEALARNGIRSYYGFPLPGQDGRPVGLVVALHTDPLPTTSWIRTVFQLLAARAGAEINRIQHDRFQARRMSQVHRHLSVLNDLSMTASLRHGKVETLSNELVDAIVATLEVDRATVWLTEDSGMALKPVAIQHRDGSSEVGLDSLPLSEIRPLLLRGREQRARAIHDVLEDEDVPPILADHLERQGIRARIDGAVRLGGEVVGVVSASSIGRTRRWTEEEVQFVSDTADLLGHAILESRRREAEWDRTRLELELERAKKMEALGSLAGGVAHDFNNILASILGNAELAQYEDPEGIPELLEEILTAAEQGRGLVQQIIQFARSEDTTREPVALCAVADEVFRLVKPLAGEGVELEFDAKPDCPPIQGDTAQLSQVVLNLCTNALQAMGDRGRLRMRVSIEAPGIGLHSGEPEWVSIEVQDDGPGIEEEVRDRLFEPFFTTRKGAGGTGLGLAIVDRTVRAHGGRIEVDTQVGQGTTFTLHFPVRGALAENTDARSRPKTLRIMAVDDDREVLVLVRALLEHLRHEVVTFQDPNDALAALEEGPAVDVVLTDLLMEGISGVQLAEAVQRDHPRARTILMSASPERLNGAHRHGIATILQKPFTLQELAGALASVS